MADDVSVKFGAEVAGLIAGCRQASDAMKGFVDQTKSALSALTAPFENLQRLILGIGAVVAGGAAFKNFVDAATSAAGDTLKLQKALGITADQANALRVQLAGTGNAVDDYVASSLRLDRQVRQNEETIKRTGMATRDANGHLLNGEQLMANAISTLAKYKEGTDRNIASQVLFGRGQGETASLLKLSGESAMQAARDMEELGLRVTPQSEANAKAYKVAMHELELAFQGIKKAIGEAVLPYLTTFAQWFRQQAPNIIASMKEITTKVVNALIDVGVAVVSIGPSFDDLKARAYGAFTAIAAAAAAAQGNMVAAFKLAKESWEAFTKDTGKDAQSAIAKLEELRKLLMSGGSGAPAAKTPEPPAEKSANGLLNVDARRKAAMLAVDEKIKAEKLGLEESKVGYEADFQNLKISEDKKFALIMTASEKSYQVELGLLEQKKVLAGGEVALRQAVENQISELKARHRIEQKQLDQQALESMKAKYSEVLTEITGAFNSQLRGLLAGTTSFKQAFKSMTGDLIIAFIQMCERMAVKWAELQLAELTATTSKVAGQTAAEETGAVASLALAIPKVLKAIAGFAAETFGGIFAFLSPEMGPAAAGPAAAGAAVVTAAGAGISAYAVGAWEIPKQQLAVLHPKEAVLPAGAAQAFRDFASGGFMAGGGGDRSGDVHVHIHAFDGQSVDSWLKHGGGARKIMKAVDRARRDNPTSST